MLGCHEHGRAAHKMDLRLLQETCFHIYTRCFVAEEEAEKKGNVSMQEQQRKLHMWPKQGKKQELLQSEFFHFSVSQPRKLQALCCQEYGSEQGTELQCKSLPGQVLPHLGAATQRKDGAEKAEPIPVCLLLFHDPTNSNTPCPGLFSSLCLRPLSSSHRAWLLPSFHHLPLPNHQDNPQTIITPNGPFPRLSLSNNHIGVRQEWCMQDWKKQGGQTYREEWEAGARTLQLLSS